MSADTKGSHPKIHLGYFIYGRGLGGNGRYVLNLVERLDKTKYEITVYVYCPACDDCRQFESKLLEFGAQVRRMTNEGLPDAKFHKGNRKLNNQLLPQHQERSKSSAGTRVFFQDLKVTWYYFKLVRKIKAFFKTQNLDVLHFSLGTFPTLMHIVAGALDAGIRRVLMIVHIMEAPRPERWIDRHLTKKIIRSKIPVIALSNRMKAELIQRFQFPQDSIRVIYNGVDIDFYRPPSEKLSSDESLGVHSGEKAVLIPARLHFVKGHEYLFQAVAGEKKRFQNVRFLLAGDGPEQENLKKRAQELGVSEQMTFLGFRNDMRALIQRSDLVALSSLNEGFPFVLLEAMACEKPVVTTDAGAVKEMIEVGKTGYIVNLKDSKAFGDALLKVLEMDLEKRFQMGKDARLRVVENFSLEQMVEKTAMLYD